MKVGNIFRKNPIIDVQYLKSLIRMQDTRLYEELVSNPNLAHYETNKIKHKDFVAVHDVVW